MYKSHYFRNHYSNDLEIGNQIFEEASVFDKSTQTDYDIEKLEKKIEQQDILLIRAKRLIQLYEVHLHDPHLKSRSQKIFS